jgi:hypothetical protein
MNIWDDIDTISASKWGMFAVHESRAPADISPEASAPKGSEARGPSNGLDWGCLGGSSIYQKLKFGRPLP